MIWRRYIRLDVVSLVLLMIACVAGWLIVSNERDDRITALAAASGHTRAVACANVDFASGFNDFLKDAADRTRQRIGTPDELSTDKASLKSTRRIIALFAELRLDVEPVCGPLP